MLVYICNINTQEATARGLGDQPQLYSKFEVILDYIKTLSQKQRKQVNRESRLSAKPCFIKLIWTCVT